MVYENSSGMYKKKKKIQSVLVDSQHGIGRTLRVKPLTWGHGSNFGSPGIWVVTDELRDDQHDLDENFVYDVGFEAHDPQTPDFLLLLYFH